MRTYEETIKALNEMIPEIHENAIEHGWWEGGRDTAEIYALFHSELSEALEEYRNNKPYLYCEAHGSDWCQICYGDTCEISPEIDCLKCFALREESDMVPHKPEGTIVELADVVIRIMDYLGESKSTFFVSETWKGEYDFIKLVSWSHAELSRAFMSNMKNGNFLVEIGFLSEVVSWIGNYALVSGYDLVDIVKIKHNYNKTRSYKHGGKKI